MLVTLGALRVNRALILSKHCSNVQSAISNLWENSPLDSRAPLALPP